MTLMEIASEKKRDWVSIEHSISITFFQDVIWYRFVNTTMSMYMQCGLPLNAGSKASISISTACLSPTKPFLFLDLSPQIIQHCFPCPPMCF